MPSTFEKLNLKNQNPIVVINAPESFEPELAGLRGVMVIRDVKSVGEIEFFLAFVTKQKEVDTLARAVVMKATEDAVVWFSYPKGTSKKYKSEINRDEGWQVLGKGGLEPVRMVAIDEDWSAVRFRRVELIKRMTRSRAISVAGKARLKKN
jgi:hypothetical protein